VSPDRDDYLDDDAAAGRAAPRGILAAGWLRALLVLATLAVVLVITVPYALEWLAPEPRPTARPSLIEPPKSETTMTQTQAPVPAPPVAVVTPPGASPEPTAKTEPAPRSEVAVKPEATSKSEPPAKPEAALKAEPAAKPAPPAAKDAAPERPAPKPAAARAATPAPATPGGEYWVQVGLFASGDNAERLAKELRKERFSVEVAQATRGGAAAPVSRHEVLVEGASVEMVNAALKGAGTAETAAGAVVVRPAMDLKDAVTLSRRLAAEGLQVRIRRVGEPSGAGSTVYFVRVGGYPTRDAAAAGQRELAAKGVSGFVTQGPVK
jgi:cell division septation protein DedD